MKIKKIIKGIAFVLIFLVCFSAVQTVLEYVEIRDSNRIGGLFEERENSLDAVFLGSSATYTFWGPPLAFAEYGITVHSFSSSWQTIYATKFMIDDALKTQPDALYIINISKFYNNYDQHLQRLLIDYPVTLNKYLMTAYLCDMYDMSLSESMEYFFPIIRFHGRWNVLTKDDFFPEKDPYKNGSAFKSFLKKTEDVGKLKYNFDTRAELSETEEKGIKDLLDYCEKKNVKVLFLVNPQVLSKGRLAEQNTVLEMVEERGFDILDLRKHVDEIGLDPQIDYYNKSHTNIHGSIKVTDYISRYLIENYGFEDKRGQEEYSDWTEASSNYYEKISKYLNKEDYKYLKSIK